MLKREGWQTLQEARKRASKPSDDDWARLFARLARELEAKSFALPRPKENEVNCENRVPDTANQQRDNANH